MPKLKAILGYTIAVLMIFAMFLMLTKRQMLAEMLLKINIKPTAWYSGGEAAQTITRNGYSLTVNHPVFRRLLGDTSDGFVQLHYIPQTGLPAMIQEQVSVDGYRFTVAVDTAKLTAQLVDSDGYASKAEWVYRFSDNSVAVRIDLKNKNCGVWCKTMSTLLSPLLLLR